MDRAQADMHSAGLDASSPLQLSSVTPATPVIFIVHDADVVTKLLVPLPVKQVWPPRGRVLGETLVTTECALLPQSSNVIARALVLATAVSRPSSGVLAAE